MPQKLRLKNSTRGTLLADRADIAETSAKRRQGLLKRTEFPAGEGLWIVPCEAVHTFGMNFPIDVVYLSRKRRVIKIRPAMKRSRMSLCLRAYSVVELPAGTAALTGTVPGDEIEIEKFEAPG